MKAREAEGDKCRQVLYTVGAIAAENNDVGETERKKKRRNVTHWHMCVERGRLFIRKGNLNGMGVMTSTKTLQCRKIQLGKEVVARFPECMEAVNCGKSK